MKLVTMKLVSGSKARLDESGYDCDGDDDDCGQANERDDPATQPGSQHAASNESHDDCDARRAR